MPVARAVDAPRAALSAGSVDPVEKRPWAASAPASGGDDVWNTPGSYNDKRRSDRLRSEPSKRKHTLWQARAAAAEIAASAR